VRETTTPATAADTTLPVLGSSYCTYAPDTSCYLTGWPACCSEGASTCPDQQPACEVSSTTIPSSPVTATIILGSDYCTYGPDYNCYSDGWPSCCIEDETTCPEEQPPCIPGASFCTYAPDFSCYETGWPACCSDDASTCPQNQPPCEITSTTSSLSPNTEIPVTAFTALTLPEGGLRTCNEVIEMDYPDNILPKEIILAILEGMIEQSYPVEAVEAGKEQMAALVKYDLRAHKICATCEEANAMWEAKNACIDGEPCTSKSFASEVMTYCMESSFAYGRTMSGLLLEPIDSVTKDPIVGRVAVSALASWLPLIVLFCRTRGYHLSFYSVQLLAITTYHHRGLDYNLFRPYQSRTLQLSFRDVAY